MRYFHERFNAAEMARRIYKVTSLMPSKNIWSGNGLHVSVVENFSVKDSDWNRIRIVCFCYSLIMLLLFF